MADPKDPFGELPLPPSPDLVRALDEVVLRHTVRPFISRNELVSDLAEAVSALADAGTPLTGTPLMPKPSTCGSCWFCKGLCDDSSGNDHCADSVAVDCANPNQTDFVPGTLDGTCGRYVAAGDVSLVALSTVNEMFSRRHYIRMRVIFALQDLRLPPFEGVAVVDDCAVLLLAGGMGLKIPYRELDLPDHDPLREVLRTFRDMSAALDDVDAEEARREPVH